MARSNSANSGHTYVDLVIQVVATYDDRYTLRAVVYLTSLNVVDSSNSLAIGGNWARSGTLALNGVYSAVPAWYADVDVARVYGADTVASVSMSWSGVEYWAATLTASESYTVPARPYSLPAAPTGVTVARVSDTQQTVSWTRVGGDSSSAPYQSQQVQRATDGGAWATVATLAGSATSWSDATTAADHLYAYRVVAVNSSGSTASTSSAGMQTTPGAPTSASAAKTAGGDITVSWVDGARSSLALTWELQHSTDGGSTWSAQVSGIARGTTTYTHTAPSTATTHTYRVRAVSATGASTTSAWVTTGTVQLLAAPNAPTGLAAVANPSPATEPVVLSWTHNPVDSTPQSKYQLRYRVAGAGSWTTPAAVTSSTQGVTVTPSAAWAAANGTAIEWQVMTWGSYATGSAWSATSTLVLSSRPTATIASPAAGAVIATSALAAAWAYYDAEGSAQSAWAVELRDGSGTLVESQSAAGTATSATLATVLPDGSSWSVRVRVQDGVGLWSEWDSHAVTVDYAEPPTPTVVPTWDPWTGTVALAIAVPAPTGGQVSAVSVDVFRSIDDGPEVLIATGVPVGAAVTDFSPTVAGTNGYRVEAVSALPSRASSVGVEQVTDDARAVYVSGGPGFSVVCLATSNAQIDDEDGPDRALLTFAGRDRPVEDSGTMLTGTLTLDADILALRVAQGVASSAEQWRDLGRLPGLHLWRDVTGRYLYVSLGRPRLTREPGGLVHHLQVTATVVDDA
jgi:hypothetical protein